MPSPSKFLLKYFPFHCSFFFPSFFPLPRYFLIGKKEGKKKEQWKGKYFRRNFEGDGMVNHGEVSHDTSFIDDAITDISSIEQLRDLHMFFCQAKSEVQVV